MFYDLNVKPRSSRSQDRQNIAVRALELGYSCIAWNVCTFGKLGASKQHKPLQPVELNTMQLKNSVPLRSIVTNAPVQLRQFSRVTVFVDELADAQSLLSANENMSAFDIVAACPATSKVLSFLCKQADIDIICLDFTHRLPFSLNKKLIDAAVSRGIVFEIVYSSLITTPGSRRQIMSSTRTLIQFLRGSSIIISSGSEAMSHMRGPQDIAAIAQLLGVNVQKARKTMSENCAVVLKHAASRKLKHLPVEVISMEEFHRRWPEYGAPNVQTSTENVVNVPTSSDSVHSDSNSSNDDGGSDESEDEEEARIPEADRHMSDQSDVDGFIRLADLEDRNSDDGSDDVVVEKKEKKRVHSESNVRKQKKLRR
mmetsp:Transcript_15891/g.23934  ORF Transcript_15891/g.23934 Transcript_15891/m.23934 type:complete len:369 (+) Transcript_15891:58-1164(+)